MPSFKNEKKEYSYPKQKFSLKNKKPFNNFKRHNEWQDNKESEKPKWMKVSCSNETPACMPNLIKELEQIMLRFGNTKISLQAINPTFKDGKLEFYLKMSKIESKILNRNIYCIEKYNIKCIPFDDVNIPHTFPQDWLNVIMQALDKRFSKNDATGETAVNLSNFSKDSFLTEQGLLLKLSNPHVMKNIFSIIQSTNLKTITKLDLSGNAITNIYQLELFLDQCSVLQIDLSDNNLSRPADFKFMAKNTVIDLSVTNNDFHRKYNQRQLQDELRKLIPRLEILNGKRLPASVIIAGETAVVKKTLPESVFSEKNSEVYKWVLQYLAAFDNDTRDDLWAFYSSESVFSLNCYSSEMPRCYRALNSNIFQKSSSPGPTYMKGKAAIVGAFSGFPRIKHLEETLNIDVIFQTDSMMFTVTGVFIELSDKGINSYRPRQFSRTFVINQGSIIQDQMSLWPFELVLINKYKRQIDLIREKCDFPIKYKNELIGVPSVAIEIVRQFKLFTGMTVKACLEFLSMVDNVTEANEKFTNMQQQGGIPAEAYETK